MSKIKSGDQVIIIAGKNKGARGTVLRSMPEKERVVVEGVNMIKKHMKPNPQRNVEGGIVEKEAPIHVSNVALINPATDKADRVGFKTLEDGKKVRFFKSNGEVVDI
ncbi:50S ribosomal protein L24 [Thiotrichales bacterium 19X7-9]|nr:50S ribosomal protein L24 [Thiotrichales bacterium 19X7-9]TNF66746.1 MAG: 50S ribosomal protein L24 [Gammaproteobacteria bacterium]UTW43943.1 50S ribosomal protein L24 [bacterium SCSIO 12844]